MLAGDACSRPPIIIRSHDLDVGNIRGAVGEIILITRGTSPLHLFGSYGLCVFWPFSSHPFLSPL